MKLAEIKAKPSLRAPARERIVVLREQLVQFRRELEGHIANLERVASWEDRNGSLPVEERALLAVQQLNEEQRSQSDPELLYAQQVLNIIRGKAASEHAAEELVHSIEKTQQLLGEAAEAIDLEERQEG